MKKRFENHLEPRRSGSRWPLKIVFIFVQWSILVLILFHLVRLCFVSLRVLMADKAKINKMINFNWLNVPYFSLIFRSGNSFRFIFCYYIWRVSSSVFNVNHSGFWIFYSELFMCIYIFYRHRLCCRMIDFH